MIHLEKLRDALQIDGDTDLGSAFELMENVLAWVSERTGRYFGEVMQFTETFRRPDGEYWLREVPVVDDDHPLLIQVGSGSSWTDLAAADYEHYDRTIIYPATGAWGSTTSSCGCWPVSVTGGGLAPSYVRVTYWAGYEVGRLPGDIEQLILELTAQRWQNRGSENLKSERIGDGYAYTLADRGSGTTGGLTRAQEDTISLWRHPVFA